MTAALLQLTCFARYPVNVVLNRIPSP